MSEANGQVPAGQTPAPVVQPIVLAEGSVVRSKVDGQNIDVPAAVAQRYINMGGAAEKRLQESNAYYTANREKVDFADRMANVARSLGVDPMLLTTNPDAALKALAARQGGQSGGGSPSQAQLDESDPTQAALRALEAKLDSKLNQVGAQVTSLNNARQSAALDQQIESVLDGYPLFTSNPAYRDMAKRVAVATWLAEPQKSLQDVAGEVHAKFGEAETAKANHERDSRTLAEQRLRGIPAGQGQPGMSTPEGPKFTKEDREQGRNPRQWMKDQVGRAWGSVK